ncbi:acyl-CoA synthetase [Geminicoccus roseus]|uniref:acyl-CoA synthetase n=1 Tax=Geminicoccus roseus TaxID=404900 RepID=UPI000417A205|nr:acyl-CoA synthetase [Geminicoccus roseus]
MVSADDPPSIYAQDLPRARANHQALTPLVFLDWAADIYGDRVGCIYGRERRTWRELRARCRRLASALRRAGVGRGDTVSVMLPNVPAMLEAHYGIPMAGAVLNALNYRLDPATIAFILEHAESKVLITDTAFAPVIRDALARLKRPILVVDMVDPEEPGQAIGQLTYEELLDQGDPDAPPVLPADEWAPISLCYTSGTTGNPKGVVYHHRGAHLNAMGNALLFGLRPDSVYLWTLPMFHCNGWTYTWAVTAVGGTHVCLRRVEPARIFQLIAEEQVSHLCGAPIILNMLSHSPKEARRALARPVDVLTGGAAPPSIVIQSMEAMGFRVTHAYGLTEVYGPATFCLPQPGWQDLPVQERAERMARQGVRTPVMPEMQVADPQTMRPVPADGVTIGEIMLRGHSVMAGYLKNPKATAEAFAGDWYHTGDLAVLHPDGYAEVKDRAKDIIISGGENISSLEVEEVLYRHPAVMEAAVVARPDEKWGEVPCAFLVLKPDAAAPPPAELTAWLKQNLAHYKVPRHFVFGPLPKTSTGKVQKNELRQRARALS